MSNLHNPIDPKRAHHDVGGLPAAAVEAAEHDYGHRQVKRALS